MSEEDDLFSQFGDIDSQKIALEAAAKGLTDMFKAFRAQGLTITEAAVLVSTLMKENADGDFESHGKPEHEA